MDNDEAYKFVTEQLNTMPIDKLKETALEWFKLMQTQHAKLQVQEDLLQTMSQQVVHTQNELNKANAAIAQLNDLCNKLSLGNAIRYISGGETAQA